MRAVIVGPGQEAEGDYHLILTSLEDSDSLIGEITDPTCKKVKGFPGLVKDYTAARRFIEDNIDQSPAAFIIWKRG